MKIVSAGSTNIGRKRKVNQDSFLMEPGSKLFVVADGMGGHAGGETASKLTVETVIQSVLTDKASNLSSEPGDLVMGAIHRANSAVHSTAEKNPKLAGMGTTVVAVRTEIKSLADAPKRSDAILSNAWRASAAAVRICGEPTWIERLE